MERQERLVPVTSVESPATGLEIAPPRPTPLPHPSLEARTLVQTSRGKVRGREVGKLPLGREPLPKAVNLKQGTSRVVLGTGVPSVALGPLLMEPVVT